MNEQIPTPSCYTLQQLIAFGIQAETRLGQNTAADLFQAVVASHPLDDWPDLVAVGLTALLREHPEPATFLAHLSLKLADLLDTL
jgi:hypothetical protein